MPPEAAFPCPIYTNYITLGYGRRRVSLGTTIDVGRLRAARGDRAGTFVFQSGGISRDFTAGAVEEHSQPGAHPRRPASGARSLRCNVRPHSAWRWCAHADAHRCGAAQRRAGSDRLARRPPGHVCVGCGPSEATRLLPIALNRLRERSPGINVTVLYGLNEALMPMVKHGEVDFALSSIPPRSPDSGFAAGPASRGPGGSDRPFRTSASGTSRPFDSGAPGGSTLDSGPHARVGAARAG